MFLYLSLSLYGSTSMDWLPAAEKATAASCILFFSDHFDMCILSLDENTILLIDFYKQKGLESR